MSDVPGVLGRIPLLLVGTVKVESHLKYDLIHI